jgi:hypothetical protein
VYGGNKLVTLYVGLSISILGCKADDDLPDAFGGKNFSQRKQTSSSAVDQGNTEARPKPIDESEGVGGYLIDPVSVTTQPNAAGILVSGKMTAGQGLDIKKAVIYSTKTDRAGLETIVIKGSSTATNTSNYQINAEGEFSFESGAIDAGFLVMQASAESTAQIQYSSDAKASNIVIINSAAELSADDLAQKANADMMSPNEPDVWISRGPVQDFGNTLKAGGQYDTILTLVNSGSGRAKISNQAFAIIANEGLLVQFRGGIYPGTVPAVDSLPPACTTILEAGAKCRFSVSFASQVAQKSEARLTLTYTNDAGSRTANVSKLFKGDFLPAATISISPGASDAFQNLAVNTTKAIYVTMVNSGDTEATIQNAEFRDDATGSSDAIFKFTDANGYPGRGEPTPTSPMCGTTLAPTATCRLHIQFTPAEVARYSRTLHVAYRYLDKTDTAKRTYNGSTPNVP